MAGKQNKPAQMDDWLTDSWHAAAERMTETMSERMKFVTD